MMAALWDKLDPGFFDPVWLLVGLLAMGTLLLLEIGAMRRRRQALRLFAASHLVPALTGSISWPKRIAKRVLLISATGLLFLALARPYLFYGWTDEHRTGLDILLAVDCSKSMLTEDVKPNRIERAKLAIADFAERLPDNRLGLIAFAGDAFLQCPLTLDHDAFQTAVRGLDTDTIPRPGTDIAAAIDEAVDALRSQPSNLKFLILVTDGEDLEGRVLESAKKAAQNGLKIYTVGVGTPAGGLIPERDDAGNMTYHHDDAGQIVQSKLDESTLRQVAELTGGAYEALGQQGEGLEKIYDNYIATLPKQNLEERRERIHIERFEWPLGAAILCLMLEFMLNERARAKMPLLAPISSGTRRPARRRAAARAMAATPLLAVGLLVAGGTNAAQAKGNTSKAEQSYRSGNYEDALQNYRSAAGEQPDRKDLQYDLGTAAYKAGEYQEAEDAFRKALDTDDLGLQERTYYNLGNTQYQDGAALQKVDTKKTIGLWEQALHSYDSALQLKNSTDAKHNYDVVKAKLDKLKQQQQQEQQKKDKDGQSQQNQKDQSGKDSSQSQSQGGGQGDQGQQPNQPGQQGGQMGKDGQGNQPDPNKSGSEGKDGQQMAQGHKEQPNGQTRAYSGSREQDQQDPAVKSRREAENLLDSLKDDEKQITARSLSGDNEQAPPPSGKDW